ncbi:L-rhamnose isomerase [subsurface metagenome]
MNEKKIESAYQLAKEEYDSLGVDVVQVISKLNNISLSLHCWQADDVGGFETSDAGLSGGGIQVTGNYPGKAGNVSELRNDLGKVLSLLPGKHRINLHAIYGEFGNKRVDRDEIRPDHFQGWIYWARANKLKLDFNPTLFSHPKADAGFTLSSKNESVRKFWIEHVKRCREIGGYFGLELNSSCVHNIWIPDGTKDTSVDRYGHRSILKESLDEIFEYGIPEKYLKDSVESKLFGIGSESFVVGSYDFYLAYAAKNNKMICLDNGHFHPTESVGDKISSCLQFVNEILLHLTRGVRWDSDHVVTMNDEILLIAQEVVRADALSRVHIGLDFFDASINRVGAYVVGARAALKSFLYALLEPKDILLKYEEEGRNFERLALLEEMKTKPFGAIWNYYCLKNGVIPDEGYISEIKKYENEVLLKR